MSSVQENATLRAASFQAMQEEEVHMGNWPEEQEPDAASEPSERAEIAEWITQLGMEDMLDLSQRTIHLALLLLDLVNIQFLDRGRVPLAAIACLLISSKHEEEEKNVPSLSQLDWTTGQVFSPALISKMEKLVLNRLGWKVTRWTAISFLENMIARGACVFHPLSDQFEGTPLRADRIPILEGCLIGYARFFCDVNVQDIELRRERRSLTATAALVCSRRALKVTPEWPDHFAVLSFHTFEQVRQQVELLWTKYMALSYSSPN